MDSRQIMVPYLFCEACDIIKFVCVRICMNVIHTIKFIVAYDYAIHSYPSLIDWLTRFILWQTAEVMRYCQHIRGE